MIFLSQLLKLLIWSRCHLTDVHERENICSKTDGFALSSMSIRFCSCLGLNWFDQTELRAANLDQCAGIHPILNDKFHVRFRSSAQFIPQKIVNYFIAIDLSGFVYDQNAINQSARFRPITAIFCLSGTIFRHTSYPVARIFLL